MSLKNFLVYSWYVYIIGQKFGIVNTMSEYFKKYITGYVTGSLENSFVKSANLAFDLHTWNWIIVYFSYFIAIIISIERLREKINPEKERFFDVTRYPYNNSTLFDRLQLSKFLKSRYYEYRNCQAKMYKICKRIPNCRKTSFDRITPFEKSSRGKVVHYDCLPVGLALSVFRRHFCHLPDLCITFFSLLSFFFFFSPLLFLLRVSLASLAVLFAPPLGTRPPLHPAPLPSGELRDCFNTPDGQNCDPVPTTVGIYRRDLSRVFRSRLEPARAHYVAQRKNVPFPPLPFERLS